MANAYIGVVALDIFYHQVMAPNIPTSISATIVMYGVGNGIDQHFKRTAVAMPRVGSQCLSAGSTLFNNIIIKPQTVNTGIITQNTIYSATIWNAFHDAAHTITNAPPVDGIIISGLNTPLTLGAFQSVAFDFNVTMQGNLQINDKFVFATDLYPITTTFIGMRGVTFLYSPLDGYQEGCFFANDIFTSYTGYEVTTPLMLREKYKFSYGLFANNTEYQKIISAIKQDTPLQVLHPIWSTLALLTLTATIGSNTITVSTTNMRIETGDYIILFTSPTIFEVKAVSSYTASTIVLSTTLVSNWPIGTHVALARATTLIKGELAYKSDNISQFNMEFDEL